MTAEWSWTSSFWVLAFYCVLIAVASLLGGWVPLLQRTTHGRLQGYLSFSAGVMMGTALGHMLPEAYEALGRAASFWALAGMLGLLVVERFFAFHQHEVPAATEGSREHLAPAQVLEAMAERRELPVLEATVVVGLTVHTLAAGVALASSAAAAGSPLDGRCLAVFVALLVHKPADSMTIATLALSGGWSRAAVHRLNMAYALVAPLGVLGFFALRGWMASREWQEEVTGAVLAMSAGAFLVIALADLLPELQFHRHSRVKLTVALGLGVGAMMLPLWLGAG